MQINRRHYIRSVYLSNLRRREIYESKKRVVIGAKTDIPMGAMVPAVVNEADESEDDPTYYREMGA